MNAAKQARPRIVPLAVVRQGLLSTVVGFDVLVRVGWLPALLLTVLGALLEPQGPAIDADGVIAMAPQVMALFIALAILAVALSAVVAVAWQRALLVPGADAVRRWHLRLGKRELLYMLVAFFLMGLASMGLAMAPGIQQALAAGQAAGSIMMLVGPVVAVLAVARTVMVLPAIALDRGADIAQSWRAAEGNTLRIALALFLTALPVMAGELFLIEMSAAVLDSDPGLLVELLLRFVRAFLSFVLSAPLVAVAGVLYALLIDHGLRGCLSRPAAQYFAA